MQFNYQQTAIGQQARSKGKLISIVECREGGEGSVSFRGFFIFHNSPFVLWMLQWIYKSESPKVSGHGSAPIPDTFGVSSTPPVSTWAEFAQAFWWTFVKVKTEKYPIPRNVLAKERCDKKKGGWLLVLLRRVLTLTGVRVLWCFKDQTNGKGLVHPNYET